MATDWQQQAESEGPVQAERIPPGEHLVRTSKVLLGGKSGPFQSKHGDPQIMVVFQDKQAREMSLMITLSDRAAWVLAKLLAAFDPPANLARLTADGITPAHFADAEFANANLFDRKLTILVEAGEDPKYSNVTPIPKRGDASAATDAPPSADAPPATDDAPPPAPQLTPITKDEAWRAVLGAWADGNKENRNVAWTNAIRETGKPESELTNDDWAKVAQAASTPF